MAETNCQLRGFYSTLWQPEESLSIQEGQRSPSRHLGTPRNTKQQKYRACSRMDDWLDSERWGRGRDFALDQILQTLISIY